MYNNNNINVCPSQSRSEESLDTSWRGHKRRKGGAVLRALLCINKICILSGVQSQAFYWHEN